MSELKDEFLVYQKEVEDSAAIQGKMDATIKKFTSTDAAIEMPAPRMGATVTSSEEMREFRERVEILAEQNSLLREEEKRWRTCEKDLVAKLDQYTKTTRDLQETLRQEQRMRTDAEAGRGELAKRADALEMELEGFEEELQTCEATRDEYMARMSSSQAELRKCQRELDSIRIRTEGKSTSHKKQLASLQRELSSAQAQRTQQLARINELQVLADTSADRERQLSREAESQRKQIADLMDSLGSVERLANDYKEREVENMRQRNRLQDELDEVQIKHEQASEMQNQLKQTVQRTRARCGQQVQSMQEEQDAEVERLKMKHNEKLKALYTEIQELEAKHATAESQKCEAVRLAQALEVEKAALREIEGGEIQRLNASLTDALAQLTEARISTEHAASKTGMLEKVLADQKKQWDSERTSRKNKYEELWQLSLTNETEMNRARDIARVQAEQIEKLERAHTQTKQILASTKAQAEQELTSGETRRAVEVEDLRGRMSDIQQLHTQAESQIEELVTSQTELSRKWRSENRRTIIQYETSMKELCEGNSTLTSENIRMREHIGSLERNRDDMLDRQEKQAEMGTNYAAELNESRDVLTGVQVQLTSLQDNEQSLLGQNTQLRSELDETELQLQRAKRELEQERKNRKMQEKIMAIMHPEEATASKWGAKSTNLSA